VQEHIGSFTNRKRMGITMKISRQHITEKEAATYLGMSPQWLRKGRANAFGPKFQKFGGAIRYNLEELKRWTDASSPTFTGAAENGPPTKGS